MSVTTFADDLLELEAFSKRLEKFIDTEHRFVEGGLVLALSSKYGTGKTTFLNMWRSALIAADDKKRIVVSLNAWESDYLGDPLYSIVSALAHTFSEAGKDADKVVEAAKDLGWFVTAIGSQVAEKFTGIKPVEAGELAEKKKQQRQEVVSISDAFSVFEKRKAAMTSLKKAIQDLIESSTPRVLFLVDELDRCRPDYAITYLETIKHIFDISGAVFILAADRKQLESSAKTAFGQDLDFNEYYRKFVHREVTLPPISASAYQKIVDQYVNRYLVIEGSRFCYMKLDQTRVEEITDLIKKLQLTPRQIQEVFRTLGHLLETGIKANSGNLYWAIGVGSLAMAIFKIGAPNIFYKLGNKKLKPEEALAFLRTVEDIHIDWWFALIFTGDGLDVSENTDYDTLLKEIGLKSAISRSDLNEYSNGWGRMSRNRFPEIYSKIQHIDQWK
ncbi:KAP family P-loop NTPase fold protein [Methylophilus sp. UBA6697]|jgi:hypothetical protein|uniref:KAP family P-loop NTPase fold protein n=1 Tax=Methylophilus sp. UBA6697 TaxID=1946902 RepID=UPI000EBC23FB|nr:P-loop NTPase fold protein [Methylophilus sp. UBA6697]HCU84864.1 hypothetical protein [Methylophilus sp.]